MKTTDELDRILNDALSEYGEAEPLAGLENRVLRRVQQQSGRPQLWWRWSFTAGLAMALLTVAAWIELRDRPYQPMMEQSTAQQLTTVPDTARNLAVLEEGKRDYPEAFPSAVLGQSERGMASSLKAADTVARRPTRNRFPVPAALTPEELALMALARTNPEALQTLPRNDEQLAIVPIMIQPLTNTDGDDQGDN